MSGVDAPYNTYPMGYILQTVRGHAAAIRKDPVVQLPEDTVDDLLKRLRRIEGQVRGIQQMLVDGRECRDVVTQISAASTALDQTGFKLVASGLVYCLNQPERAVGRGIRARRRGEDVPPDRLTFDGAGHGSAGCPGPSPGPAGRLAGLIVCGGQTPAVELMKLRIALLLTSL